MKLLLGVILSAALLLSFTFGQLVSTGLTVTLNGIDYFISPYSSGNVTTLSAWNGTLPISGRKPIVFSLRSALSSAPSGPYFLNIQTGALHPVYRLYDDSVGAFVESILQTPSATFQPLSAHVSGSATLTIGVPSRLYYTRTPNKPLAGVRVCVKDIFRLSGVRGSNGNRAWYSLYPPSNITATAVQRLVDAGAVVVGLHKASQFANDATATADWVDYHAPFNPRGDGYQDPSSSSSGGGAAMAAYGTAWLDLALGSDTGGSIRGPGGANGVFGNRPTHGLVSLDHDTGGVMPLSPVLDTAGLLARDPYLWDTAQHVLYANYTSFTGTDTAPDYPTTIYVLDYLSTGDSTTPDSSNIIISAFLKGLARIVNGSYEPLILEDAWSATGLENLRNVTTLSAMLNMTYATLITADQIQLVSNPFYADYAAAHDGRRPFIDPVPLARWAYGDALPTGLRDQALANKTIFAEWFNSNILVRLSDNRRCTSALAMYVGDVGGDQPRNAYLDAPMPDSAAPFGFSANRISTLAGCPDSVFPLRTPATVFSAITGHSEEYPVAVDVIAARGCDGLLARLAQDLSAVGLVGLP